MSERPPTRPATADELPALIALARAAILGLASRDYSPAQIAAWASRFTPPHSALAERLGRQAILVATDAAGAIAGFVSIAVEERDALIDLLYVHPDHARRGVGRALLTDAIDLARARGATEAHAEVSLTARPLFERAGFLSVAEQHPVIDGVALSNSRMRRPL